MSNSCDFMDCSPPGSSVHGISQAWILEWVAISSSGRSSRPRDWTHIFCIGRPDLYQWATREARYKTKPQPLEFLYTGFIYCFLMAQSNAGYRRRGSLSSTVIQGVRLSRWWWPWFRALESSALDQMKGVYITSANEPLQPDMKVKWSCSVLYDSLGPYGL